MVLRFLIMFWRHCELSGKPEYKDKCEKNKRNRASDVSGCVYAGGSISVIKHKRRMALEIGREPTIPEVFKRINFRKGKNPAEAPKWINQKAADTYVAYEKLKETSQIRESVGGQCSQSSVNDFELILNAIGGKNKKDRAYRFGSEASMLGASSCIKSSAIMPDEMQVMRQQIKSLAEPLNSMQNKFDKYLSRQNVDEASNGDDEDTEDSDDGID